jgi:hypothetical protein
MSTVRNLICTQKVPHSEHSERFLGFCGGCWSGGHLFEFLHCVVSTSSYVSEEHTATIFRLTELVWVAVLEWHRGNTGQTNFSSVSAKTHSLHGVETKRNINLSIAVKPQFVLHRVSACFTESLLKILHDSNNFSSIWCFYSFFFPLCFFKACELSSVMPVNVDSYQGAVFIMFVAFTFFSSSQLSLKLLHVISVKFSVLRPVYVDWYFFYNIKYSLFYYSNSNLGILQ